MIKASAIWSSGAGGAEPPLAEMPQPSAELIRRIGWIPASYLALYQQAGPVARVRGATGPMVVLNGAEANVFWSQAANDHLRMADFRRSQNAEYGVGKTIVSSDGAEHSRMRKALKQGYSRSALDDRYPELIAIAEAALRRHQPGDSVAVLPLMTRIATQQLGGVVLNHAPDACLDEIALFLRTVILTTLARRWPASYLESPAYCYAKSRVLALADEIIAAERAATAPRKASLVHDLLAAAAEDPDFLTDQEVRIALLGPFIGGVDTVASTSAFMLYALLAHPELLERVSAEVDAIFAAGGPTPQNLKSMQALYHTLLETLRLYAVTPALQGTVVKPFAFAGHRVDAGQSLCICTAVPHYLPQFFADPLRFDIERYGKDRQEHRRPGVYAPFGLGSHSCLGAGQAEVLIMLTIATLLRSARLALDPPEYRLNIVATTLPAPDSKLRVRVLEQRA